MIVLASLGRRLLLAVPTLLVVSLLLFAALRLLPSDPVALSVSPAATGEELDQARFRMGADRSAPVQYAIWIGQFFTGDLGLSVQLHRPVAQLLAEALPATVELAGLAFALGTVLGLAGGLLLFALRGEGGDIGREAGHGGVAAGVAEAGAALLMSVPDFIWALLLVLVFGVALEALPLNGRLAPDLARPAATGFLLADTLLAGNLRTFASAAQHMVLPTLALALAFAPHVMRHLCAALVEIHAQGHIRQARLRGLSGPRVLLGHALRSAAEPVLVVMSTQCGVLFAGTLLVETIFAYPGLGSLLLAALRNADLPVIEACVLTGCALVVLVQALLGGLRRALPPRLPPR